MNTLEDILNTLGSKKPLMKMVEGNHSLKAVLKHMKN